MDRTLAWLAIVLVAGPAASQTGAEGGRRAPFTPGPPVSLPECTCRAAGREWRLGETVCLKTASGERLATCAMDLNVTSWRITDVPCASSSLSKSRTAWLTLRKTAEIR